MTTSEQRCCVSRFPSRSSPAVPGSSSGKRAHCELSAGRSQRGGSGSGKPTCRRTRASRPPGPAAPRAPTCSGAQRFQPPLRASPSRHSDAANACAERAGEAPAEGGPESLQGMGASAACCACVRRCVGYDGVLGRLGQLGNTGTKIYFSL